MLVYSSITTQSTHFHKVAVQAAHSPEKEDRTGGKRRYCTASKGELLMQPGKFTSCTYVRDGWKLKRDILYSTYKGLQMSVTHPSDDNNDTRDIEISCFVYIIEVCLCYLFYLPCRLDAKRHIV